MKKGHSAFPLDSQGRPFSKPSIWLPPKEYGKIVSEINAVYDVLYEESYICVHVSYGVNEKAYVYWFENHGFNDYNFFRKVPDNH